jgi:hypothetical protein
MVSRIKFPKNFGKQVREGFSKSKRITGMYEVHNNILYFDSNDIEEAEKIFDRLVLNFKIV